TGEEVDAFWRSVASHGGRVAVAREPDAHPAELFGASGELWSLLGPGGARAGEDPGGAVVEVVPFAAHDGGVAVEGQRDVFAEFGGADPVGGHEFGLLGPASARPHEDPRRTGAFVGAQVAEQRGAS